MDIDKNIKKKLIVITGPTAVGKTATSVRLAKDLDAEIVCADSVQIYRGMDIGSAKVKPEEMDGVPHHMLDIADFSEPFSVAKYKEEAKKCIDDIHARGKFPILVGGTGFYIAAVLKDTNFDEEEEDKEYEAYLDTYELEHGKEELARLLKGIDLISYETIHYNNSKRIKRALMYYHIHKEAISAHNEREKERKSPYDFSYFVLSRDRENLYENINKRVDIMLDEGLIEEVRALKKQGLNEATPAGQAIGYKEVLAYLEGRLEYERMVDLVKQNSRRYAKRQMTWFRREKYAQFINVENMSTEQILEKIKNKKI